MAGPFRTQTDVDAEIRRHMANAAEAEARRDADAWESTEYWRHHDDAMEHHERARLLMPRGS